jgi:peptidase E
MKLFLASAFDKTISRFLEVSQVAPNKTRVAFVADASDVYEGQKPWVDNDRKAFVDAGFAVEDVKLEHLANVIDEFDILHLCGGSTLYLAYQLQELNLINIIREQVLSDKIMLMATSAGSMVAAQSVNLKKFYDPEAYPENQEVLKKMKSFETLNLVDFLIMPHLNSEIFVKGNKEVMEQGPKIDMPLLFLNDNQAVWVTEDGFKVLR